MAGSLLTLALLAALLAPVLAKASAGDLDRSFGDGGRVSDGLLSFTTRGCLRGHRPPRAARRRRHGQPHHRSSASRATTGTGSLDRSFSGNGRVRTSFGAAAGARSVAIDSRGRIVAAGGHGLERNHIDSFALARYRPNGTLDPSFGADGKVTTAFGGHAAAESVAIDSHGPDRRRRWRRQRLRARPLQVERQAWTPRSAPAVRWRRTSGPATPTYAVAIDSSGGSSPPARRSSATGDDFAHRPLRPQRQPRTASFGTGGQVTTDFGGLSAASSVAIDSRDRIVAAGGGPPDEHIKRLRARPLRRQWEPRQLVLRRRQGDDVVRGDHARANSVAIDSRGRIVAAGGSLRRSPATSGMAASTARLAATAR